MSQFERLRRICLALPEATEKQAWGRPTFRIRDRLFAMFADNHHGDGRIAVWLHAPEGTQEMLVEHDPELFFIPPYMGPSGWIGVCLDRCDDEELEALAAQAYCMVAPKKLRALVGTMPE